MDKKETTLPASSYRQIFKATSLIGGVQVFTILISIVRTKFVALWLGSTGVGIIGLLTAPLGIISTLTGLGIAVSAVREISEAASTKDEVRLSRTIKTFQRWVWLTGSLGMVVTILFSPFLSKWSFGNSDYIWAFIFISVTIFLADVTAGQTALLQGLRRLKEMFYSTIIGSLIGLLTSLPLYYFYGIRGIVPALIITSVTGLCISAYYARKIKLQKVSIDYKSSLTEGMGMVKLGVVLTLSGLIGTVIRYLITLFISQKGSVEQVGLYQSGFSIITAYVGLVFTAMGTDYLPRLAGIKDIKQSIIMMNQQIEMALLIISPLCIALIIGLPFIIRLFYTESFLPVIPMMEWILLAISIKALVWSIGMVFLAKGDYATSFKIDNITNLILLGGYIGMYSLLGLQGIGIADFFLYCAALILTYFFAKKKYGYAIGKDTLFIVVPNILLILAVFLLLKNFNRNSISYIISFGVLGVSSSLSFLNLNKRLHLSSLVSNYLNR